MSMICAGDNLRSFDIFEIKLGLISRSYQEADFDPEEGRTFQWLEQFKKLNRLLCDGSGPYVPACLR